MPIMCLLQFSLPGNMPIQLSNMKPNCERFYKKNSELVRMHPNKKWNIIDSMVIPSVLQHRVERSLIVSVKPSTSPDSHIDLADISLDQDQKALDAFLQTDTDTGKYESSCTRSSWEH
ncbi:hypothetical protein NP493_6399g00001, partial [Ridgeia piscesae]